ncbi:MAG: PqqD family protein [Verrucomicrobia bacterium]|nr:PqqD family protein [Verrucomicrobiota bacterium]MDA1088175.1 PqqD family protein [Verrucomicrobiota bacterium]
MGFHDPTEATAFRRRRALLGVPVLQEHVRVEQCAKGVMTLHAKCGRGPSIFERFRPPVVDRKYELDEFGAFVVSRMDRERSVRDIIGEFQSHFGMSRREAELGVGAFLKILTQRNVAAVLPGKGARAGADHV